MKKIICSNHLCGKGYNVKFDNCPFCGAPNPKDESERRNMIANDKEFNLIVILLIWISIFFGIREIMSSFMIMDFSPDIGCLTLVLSIIGIVSLIYILRAKEWALFMWMAYRLIAGIVNGYISSKYDFATNIIIAIANIGLMVLVLQIKKSGVSAWSIIFNKEKSNEINNESENPNVYENLFENENSNNVDRNISDTLDSSVEDRTTTETQIDNSDVLQTENLLLSMNETIQIEEENITTISEEPSMKSSDNTSAKPQESELDKHRVRHNRETCLIVGKWWIFPLTIVTTLTIVWIVVWISHRQNETKLRKENEYSISKKHQDYESTEDIHGQDYPRPENSINTDYERWDASNYNYSNFTYGFGWDLPKDYKWEKIDGQEKHTVFRAAGYPFVVFVNAQVAVKDKDLWGIYDQYTEMMEQLDVQYEKKTGKLAYERTFEKCILLGQHAIKTTFKEYFKDSRYDEAQENYSEEYIMIANGYILTIALKMPKDVYDSFDCSSAISEIFKGFRFTVKH